MVQVKRNRATTDSLTLTVSNKNKDNLYRCKITGYNDAVIYSTVAGMEIVEPVRIVENPSNVNVSENETPAFTVDTENAAIIVSSVLEWFSL